MEIHDNEIVRRCLEGDADLFSDIIDKYQKPIFNVAYRMVHDFDDAEDIAQSVFIKVYENLESFNPKYKFFSWIYRIAINESLNFLQKGNKNEALNANINLREKTTYEIIDDLDLSERIQKALEKLELNYRIVIVLKHFMEFSYKEISDILEIQEKKVKSRLFTARQMMKDILIKVKDNYSDI